MGEKVECSWLDGRWVVLSFPLAQDDRTESGEAATQSSCRKADQHLDTDMMRGGLGGRRGT